MSSHLYALGTTFSKKSPPPGALRSAGVTWINACGALVYQFTLYIGGWSKAPVGSIATAAIVASQSGWLNPNAAAAPIGANHFFSLAGTTAGHVGKDLNGGGTDLIMATGRAVKIRLASYLGIQSVAGYVATGGVKYLGWATNYSQGISAYVEPVPVPVVGPADRLTVAKGANVRSLPDSVKGVLGMPLKGNYKVSPSGFIHGVAPEGSTNDVWFVVPGGYAWSGGFTDAGTHDLSEVFISWTVTFDAGLGSPTPDAQTVRDGNAIAAPTPVPALTGYTLTGWSADATTALWDFSATVSANQRLTAVWQEIPVVVTPPDSGTDAPPDSGAPDSGTTTPPDSGTTPPDSGTAPTTPIQPKPTNPATIWGTIAAVVIAVGLALSAFLFGH